MQHTGLAAEVGESCEVEKNLDADEAAVVAAAAAVAASAA